MQPVGLPDGEKQLRSEMRSVAPARVVPSCAGAMSSCEGVVRGGEGW